MKLAIMQPYTFPYIGYFQLIKHTDKWVVFDDTQFISKGWINRNRILHPDAKKQWQYFTVPLKKHSLRCKIKNVDINNNIAWRDELLGKLTSYKKKAPFYTKTIEFIYDCISFKSSSLSEWVIYTLKRTCNYLEIPFNFSIFSEMNINIENIKHAGQWALEIAAAMDASEYINPVSGYNIFNENEFRARNIELQFLKPKLTPYVQRRGHFVPGLSIIDIMMWNDKVSISNMLNDFEIFTYSKLKI